jgi:hypothetical protein
MEMNQLIGQLRDLAAKEGVQIQIQRDGLVIWINIDGVCVLRIMANGTIPIEVEDNRK